MGQLRLEGIDTIATDSELREILSAAGKGQIDYPATKDNKSVFYKKTWMINRLYPCVAMYPEKGLIESKCLIRGNEKTLKEREKAIRYWQDSYFDCFVSATPKSAKGLLHSVEIKEDGHIEAKGENTFGEIDCTSWTDIKEVSCGDWHTVGLKNDGTLVACGSNANGQCDVSGLSEKAVAVSCGRYHTAILLESGKVVIKGNLEQRVEIEGGDKKSNLLSGLPIKADFTAYEKSEIDLVENVRVGDELTVKKVTERIADYYESETFIYLYNKDDQKLGCMTSHYNSMVDLREFNANMFKRMRAVVVGAKPLSSRRQGSKYAVITVRIEYTDPSSEGKDQSRVPGAYQQTPVQDWPSVRYIKSIYDGTIGATDKGEIYIDGFTAATEAQIKKVMKEIIKAGKAKSK